ncbi:MAG TPA: TIGR00282 family metallophosphoesterase [Dehalococcoidia bacterium]|nr:TIGR00282 family metallophosphoesterase [Dehalococcoidia bacterium]
MRILMIGDVVGKPGRKAVAAIVPQLRRELRLDLVIANGENGAAGRGLTPKTADELFRAGVDVITSGNHIWDNRDIYPALQEEAPILRPLNYPPGTPGRGLIRCGDAVVLNAIGRTFMPMAYDDPFRLIDAALESIRPGTPIIVDFHAEATSEKQALAWHLDGRVSAVLGTHTHVPTADARILPRGTAFVCDVGMVGARRSVIGDDVEAVLSRFLTAIPTRLPVAEDTEADFFAVYVEIDSATGRALEIRREDRQVAIG